MKTEILTRLRTVLVQLYSQIEDAQRVSDDSGIGHSQIATGVNMTNYWHALLREAEKQSRVTELLAIVANEYPENQELVALILAWQRETMPLSNIRLLNFAHPITSEQQQQIEKILGKRIDLAIGKHIFANFDDVEPYEPQSVALAERVGFTATEWQTLPLLINPPSFVPGALCLLSELHGRMRHFPTILRLRPVTKDGSRVYEVAEIINLQEVRDRARNRV